MSVSVCVCVCLHYAGSTVGPTDLEFGEYNKDHHISNKFEGQGHRSKVKVTKIFFFFLEFNKRRIISQVTLFPMAYNKGH